MQTKLKNWEEREEVANADVPFDLDMLKKSMQLPTLQQIKIGATVVN